MKATKPNEATKGAKHSISAKHDSGLYTINYTTRTQENKPILGFAATDPASPPYGASTQNRVIVSGGETAVQGEGHHHHHHHLLPRGKRTPSPSRAAGKNSRVPRAEADNSRGHAARTRQRAASGRKIRGGGGSGDKARRPGGGRLGQRGTAGKSGTRGERGGGGA